MLRALRRRAGPPAAARLRRPLHTSAHSLAEFCRAAAKDAYVRQEELGHCIAASATLTAIASGFTPGVERRRATIAALPFMAATCKGVRPHCMGPNGNVNCETRKTVTEQIEFERENRGRECVVARERTGDTHCPPLPAHDVTEGRKSPPLTLASPHLVWYCRVGARRQKSAHGFEMAVSSSPVTCSAGVLQERATKHG